MFKCEDCNRIFAKKSNCKRHIGICKKRIENMVKNNLRILNEENSASILKEKNKVLKKEFKEIAQELTELKRILKENDIIITENNNEVIVGNNIEVTVKTVIKKKGKVKITRAMRNALWNKEIGYSNAEGECYVCRVKVHTSTFESGHIISEKNGGARIVENLKVLCPSCNSSIGSTNLDVFIRERIRRDDPI